MSRAEPPLLWHHGPPLPPAWPATIPALVAAALGRAPSQEVVRDHTGGWSWSQLLTSAAGLAAGLSDIKPGSRLVVSASNGVRHLLAELAAWHCGAIVVPLAAHTPQLMADQIMAELAPQRVWVDDQVTWLHPLQDQLPPLTDHRRSWNPWPSGPHDPAMILYTSGSSGRPKGVVLSHANICSQQAAFAQLWPTIGVGDRLASYLPWHHSFGALAERLWAMTRGACVHVVPAGGHDHEALLATIAEVRPTVFMSVPKLHYIVAQAEVLDPRILRWVFTAGAPLSKHCDEVYRQQGITVIEGWGLTEASPSVAITQPTTPRGQGRVGHPIPGVAVAVAVDNEIMVSGPGVMLGYWQRPELNARVLTEDQGRRVLATGDCGYWGDDSLQVSGRRDQQLKHPNGEKVPVTHLAQELQEHPGIDFATIVIDEHYQGLMAVVVTRTLAEEQINALMQAYNQRCKIPWWRFRSVCFLREECRLDNGLLTASHKIAPTAVVAAARERGVYRPLPGAQMGIPQ